MKHLLKIYSGIVQCACIVLILCSFSKLCAQAPAMQWQKCLGGSAHDETKQVIVTSTGEYIVVGSTGSIDGDLLSNPSHGNYDAWIVKLSQAGSIIWQKRYGGSNADDITSIDQTADGGYIAAGISMSSDGDLTSNYGYSDYWVIKLDTSGNIVWQKNYGGSLQEWATYIEQTSDLGYIVSGRSESNDGDVSGNHGTYDYWIIKLDSIGNLQWQKSYGGLNDEVPGDIHQTLDRGYIVSGYTASNNTGDVTGNHTNSNTSDYWILKLDSIGDLQWQKSLGGNQYEISKSSCQLSDGSYVVGGTAGSTNGDVTNMHGNSDEFWVVKLDTAGSILWQKAYGGNDADYCYSIFKTLDKGFVLGGITYSTDGDVTFKWGGYDYWIVKIDSAGTLQWQKSLGGYVDEDHTYVCQSSNGDYVVSGDSQSSSGDITGHHSSGNDFWIVKLSDPNNIEGFSFENNIQLYPNPSNGKFEVNVRNNSEGLTFQLFDITGRMVLERNFTGSAEINAEYLDKGIYTIQILGEKLNEVKKLIITD
jgi:hypothetical protein